MTTTTLDTHIGLEREAPGARTAAAVPAPVRNVLHVPIHAMRLQEVLDAVDAAIESRTRLLIGVVNAAKIVAMGKDKLLRDAVLGSDLVLADGMAVVWAARLLGQPLPERVAGIDLMFGMLQRGSENGVSRDGGVVRHSVASSELSRDGGVEANRAADDSWATNGQARFITGSEARGRDGYRVYCLGATEEVSQIVAERIARDYPGIVLAGRRNGYFSESEEPAIVEAIRASDADILLVAMSPPKKEIFLARWFDRLNVPVCHGVGGAFDILAGKTHRAPALWQKLGLEWLYRVFQEPRRMWKRYLGTNVAFCWMLVTSCCGSRRYRTASNA